ncbi:hypothetical protein MSMAP_0721 [Methanosarcina mazei SarPi]|uniref:Uncharacterized protein n=1 Tax=Methanosarcina mazei SarPi TaxID=1434115 RepID=A0A0E3LRW0_METMZ|nr:hypothetical protein MSMAP_0721 [Methanosarcina mazei SarPi]
MKQNDSYLCNSDLRIREQDPLKQGLKLVRILWILDISLNSRARSIKTRIETVARMVFRSYLRHSYSRARSIKTRIETPNQSKPESLAVSIREQDPLKQGLKHSAGGAAVTMGGNSRARSIKTRIETNDVMFWNCFSPYSRARSIKTRIETRPRKAQKCGPNNSRARSIKTRIETFINSSHINIHD